MSVYWIFTGTYGSADQEGIHILSLDSKTCSLEKIAGVSGIHSPSFLAIDGKRNLLFAASETMDGEVVSYQLDSQLLTLKELSRQKTNGDHPCHISIDATGVWLLAVNYTSGNVSVFPIDEHGAIGEMSDQLHHEGSSVHQDRQEAPHPHSIFNMPNTPFWVVPDLGCDRLYIYKLDTVNGKLQQQNVIPTSPGAGPRHAVFHPHEPWLYIIEELSSTITAYRYDRENGSLREIQRVTTLPEGFDKPTISADIHIDAAGAYLYGSNRGHDSLAVYRIQHDGTLIQVGHVSVEGAMPRNFVITPDDRCLLVANQDSDSVTLFELKDGIPVYTGKKMELYKPVCVKVLEVE
ncbi:lactonase family protein [Paenibacillus sp. SC116]|uniref:lactonase family protein n=1 Tax=Paenibacillus sp. SC116 TaxID=2968986 RepID=UPI00215A7AF5|nr:lactonase family protein [Paenibacillus sp. SC116]MCR8845865.1 lactonase family protein [Paenibacillus sp. SC116]